jgi:hypothetical protein
MLDDSRSTAERDIQSVRMQEFLEGMLGESFLPDARGVYTFLVGLDGIVLNGREEESCLAIYVYLRNGIVVGWAKIATNACGIIQGPGLMDIYTDTHHRRSGVMTQIIRCMWVSRRIQVNIQTLSPDALKVIKGMHAKYGVVEKVLKAPGPQYHCSEMGFHDAELWKCDCPSPPG